VNVGKKGKIAMAPENGHKRKMSAAHRRYLILELGVGAAVINFLINGAIAWGMFRSAATVPFWGQQSIGADTIGTTFFLPFFTCLIVTPLGHRQVRSGKLPALSWRRATHSILGRLPSKTLRRAFALGVLYMIAVAPPAIWALTSLGVEQMSFGGFVLFKATFAAALSVVVTPLIGLCVLGDAEAPS
jgi:hypothetical protein